MLYLNTVTIVLLITGVIIILFYICLKIKIENFKKNRIKNIEHKMEKSKSVLETGPDSEKYLPGSKNQDMDLSYRFQDLSNSGIGV